MSTLRRAEVNEEEQNQKASRDCKLNIHKDVNAPGATTVMEHRVQSGLRNVGWEGKICTAPVGSH